MFNSLSIWLLNVPLYLYKRLSFHLLVSQSVSQSICWLVNQQLAKIKVIHQNSMEINEECIVGPLGLVILVFTSHNYRIDS